MNYFLLFCKHGKVAPRLYKTRATVEKYVRQDPNLQYEKFNDMLSLEKRLSQLARQFNAGISHDNAPMPTQSTTTSSPHASLQNPFENEQRSPLNVEEFIKKHPALFNDFKPAELLNTPLPLQIHLQFDGSSRGNPGPSGIGYLGLFGSTIFFQQSLFIGPATNNQAEFTSLLWAMADCALKRIPNVVVLGDSKLAIESIGKKWNITSKGLVPYYDACLRLKSCFNSIHFKHISSAENRDADTLSKRASGRR